jgi:hypothetical protein
MSTMNNEMQLGAEGWLDRLANSLRARSIQLRSIVLLAAWALSGVWSVGHIVAHELHYDSVDHAETAQSTRLDLAFGHGHGHAHPDPLPVGAIGGSPQLGVTALLAASPEVAVPKATLRWCTRGATARKSTGATCVSGPRAPPIS